MIVKVLNLLIVILQSFMKRHKLLLPTMLLSLVICLYTCNMSLRNNYKVTYKLI